MRNDEIAVSFPEAAVDEPLPVRAGANNRSPRLLPWTLVAEAVWRQRWRRRAFPASTAAAAATSSPTATAAGSTDLALRDTRPRC